MVLSLRIYLHNQGRAGLSSFCTLAEYATTQLLIFYNAEHIFHQSYANNSICKMFPQGR
jgi:hypothetical protein